MGAQSLNNKFLLSLLASLHVFLGRDRVKRLERKSAWQRIIQGSFSILALISLGTAYGADFSITPVRVTLNATHKSETLTVKNNSDQAVSLQLATFAWEQDENAKDRFSPSEEIVAFPKLMKLEPGASRIVRIGAKVAGADREQTYRVYLEELPSVEKEAAEGAQIRTLTRVGIPVFVEPHQEQAQGEIGRLALEGGRLQVAFANKGNVHLIVRAINVQGMDAAGKAVFGSEVAGWYILPERERVFILNIPQNDCQGSRYLEIEVVADKLIRKGRLDIDNKMCVQ